METNDVATLASLLVTDPMDVLKALGGPWFEDSRYARDLPKRLANALPEHALDRDTWYGCGSELHGIVY